MSTKPLLAVWLVLQALSHVAEAQQPMENSADRAFIWFYSFGQYGTHRRIPAGFTRG